MKDPMHPARPRTGERFPAAIASPRWHLWDTAGYIQDGVTHIYAQATERVPGEPPEARYWRAYWRHFSSADEGRSWIDEGPALWPRAGRDEPDAKQAKTQCECAMQAPRRSEYSCRDLN